MKKIDYEHFGRFVYPINLSLFKNKLYFNVVKANFDENKYDSDLYCLSGKKPVRLTSSADVRSYYIINGNIVFPSLRQAKDKETVKNGEPLTVLQKLSPKGGEAEEFLRLNYNATGFAFIDEKKFYFTAAYSHAFETALKKAKNDAHKAAELIKEDADYEVLDETPFWMNGSGFTNKIRNRLYCYNNGKITPITDEYTSIETITLSSDKTTLYYIASRYENNNDFTNRLYAINIATQKTTDISVGEKVTHIKIAPMSDKIAVFATISEKYGINENYKLFTKNANEPYKMVYGGGEHNFYDIVNSDIKMARTLPEETVTNGDALYSLDTLDDSAYIIKIDTQSGKIEKVSTENGEIGEFIGDGNNGFYAIAMRKGGCEIYHITEKGEAQLTNLNKAALEKYDYSEPQELFFTNENGDTIHGYALKPSGMTDGKKYPAILDIHGGPRTSYGKVYYHEMQLWASRGYAVIYCNPTGSDGKGDKFADICGRYGETDYRDIMKFVDTACEKFDFINKDKIAVTGGSYGGFMTNWIIGHTDRFVAAASQRSIANFISFSNMSDIGWYFGNDQMGATAWTNQEKIWQQSPLKYANKVKTPTLFIHSDSDYRCPLAEGLQMFYAIKSFGVPARLCMFRGENHELSRSGKPKHRVRRLKEITEWLSEYLDK